MNFNTLFAISLFSTPLLALADAGEYAGASMSQFVFLGLLLVMMYVIAWRPQAKRQKEHQALIEQLGKGDEVLTNGGIVGKVIKLNDNFVVIEVSEGQTLTVQKTMVGSVLPKGTMKSI